ncbi:protein-tyrosine phosphatase-like protein [Ampelomyces quisqualis]|uniref:Protein-tyrosine phosphatase-like protein n=1 Tax=Ampelomyces quisqualis TaxID=50730 RepID=A0A6A5QXE6_AMPQU|nr:protein-tyrosine phosphatase-like protein [Ampelomyces quisqualis]
MLQPASSSRELLRTVVECVTLDCFNDYCAIQLGTEDAVESNKNFDRKVSQTWFSLVLDNTVSGNTVRILARLSTILFAFPARPDSRKRQKSSLQPPVMVDTLQSPLKSVLNFRDAGEFANRAMGMKRVKTGLLFRSARLDEASFQDRQRLVKDYGIRSVIDLRTKTEHMEQAQKRDANIKASAAIPHTNDQVAQPLKISDMAYHKINFNGSSFSRMLMSKLSWFEFFRLVFLMLCGQRLDAIKIIAPHMEDMGLVGLAKSSLDVCKSEVKQVFDVLADQQSWPVLVHCTQGKDRTGLIVMLLLFLLGVDEAAIDEDYRLSESELAPEREERLKEMQSIGLSEQFAVCPVGVVSTVHSHIKEKYGTTEKYLEYTGVSKEAIETVKWILTAENL